MTLHELLIACNFTVCMRKTIMSRYENTLSKNEETLLAARRLSREKHRATEGDLVWERGGIALEFGSFACHL